MVVSLQGGALFYLAPPPPHPPALGSLQFPALLSVTEYKQHTHSTASGQHSIDNGSASMWYMY